MNRIAFAVVVCLTFAAPAGAQQNEPIGRFVADFRGAYGRHKVETTVASDLGVPSAARAIALLDFLDPSA